MDTELAFQQRLQRVRCFGVQVLEQWQSGTRTAECSVIFLRLTGRWVRCFFEEGSFFWSDVLQPERDHHDGDNEYRLRRPHKAELLENVLVHGAAFAGDGGRRELAIEFESGASLRLLHDGSKTALLISSACA